MSEPEPVSPCIGVCTLDPVTQYCIGCARTIMEIAAWPRLSTNEKQRVIALLPSRRPRARGSHAGAGSSAG